MAHPVYHAAMDTRSFELQRVWKLTLALALSALAVVLLMRNLKLFTPDWTRGKSTPIALGAEQAAAGAAAAPAASAASVSVGLETVASGIDRPLFVTHAGDGSGRLFVVEQGGKIRVVRGGKVLPLPFLDLGARLDTSTGERGLLGLAFAPDFATSRRFYVAHTARPASGPVVRIVGFLANAADAADPADADRADPASESVVLEMADPAGNHNGGMLAFGPDGRLWAGTGDGGSGGDPWDNARNPASLLGKMLRLDVASATGGALPPVEIWALGLRNPWRFSFDRLTGEIWIGDVGQNAWG